MNKVLVFLVSAFIGGMCFTSCEGAGEIAKLLNNTEDTVVGVVDFTNLANDNYYWGETKRSAWVSSQNATVDLLIPPLISGTSYVTKYPVSIEFDPQGTGSNEVSYYYYVQEQYLEGGKGTYTYDATAKTLTLNVTSNAPEDNTILETGQHIFNVLECTSTTLKLQQSLMSEWAELMGAVLSTTSYSDYVPEIAIVTIYYTATNYANAK